MFKIVFCAQLLVCSSLAVSEGSQEFWARTDQGSTGTSPGSPSNERVQNDFKPFQIPMDVFDELETQLDMARPLNRPTRNFPSFDYFDSFGNFNGATGPKMASYV